MSKVRVRRAPGGHYWFWFCVDCGIPRREWPSRGLLPPFERAVMFGHRHALWHQEMLAQVGDGVRRTAVMVGGPHDEATVSVVGMPEQIECDCGGGVCLYVRALDPRRDWVYKFKSLLPALPAGGVTIAMDGADQDKEG